MFNLVVCESQSMAPLIRHSCCVYPFFHVWDGQQPLFNDSVRSPLCFPRFGAFPLLCSFRYVVCFRFGQSNHLAQATNFAARFRQNSVFASPQIFRINSQNTQQDFHKVSSRNIILAEMKLVLCPIWQPFLAQNSEGEDIVS